MPSIPPALNVPQIPPAIPSILYRAPKEGPQAITFVLDWADTIARGLEAWSINLQNQSTLEFSQICGLIVDNSECGSDLDFIFTDTDVTVSIPAYAPYTVLQVNTRQTQFVVRGLGIIAGDATRFSVLNYAPSPISVPVFTQQVAASVGTIAIDGTSAVEIIPRGINGSLRGMNVNVTWNTAAAPFNDLLTLVDGTGALIWQGNIAGETGAQTLAQALVDLSNLNVRFIDGVILEQQGGFVVGGTVDVNLYYRVP